MGMKICLFLLCVLQLAAVPAQIIILRHSEKDPVTAQLVNPQGLERAAALAYYLTSTPYLLNFGPISAVFSSRQIDQSDRIIPRTIETMMPVAEFLQLPIHSPFNGYQTEEMASFIMNSPKYNGKNIVICWNHSSIINLLSAFGYLWPFNTSKYPDCRFDFVFVLTFPQTNPYPLAYFQQLLYADPTCCQDPATCTVPCDPGFCPNTTCDPSVMTCPPYTPPPTCTPCQSP